MIQIEAGQTIGEYEVRGFLGRGAFAQVFLATGEDGRRCALKVGDESGGGRYLPRFREVTSEREPGHISPDETPAEAMFLDPHDGARAEVLDTAEVDALLEAEVALLQAARGEGVPRLVELAELGSRPMLVLEFVPGVTIREKIRGQQGVKLRWLIAVVETLERLTSSGKWPCHGDLKPENVIITPQEEVFLIDPVGGPMNADQIVTTPCYNPFLRKDAKGDTQSVAIILYELLCGALPFDQVPWDLAGTDASLYSPEERRLSRSFFLSYPRPRDLNPRTPTEIERIIFRCLCDGDYGLRDLRFDLEDFLLRR